MAYKNLYVPDKKDPAFVAWNNAIKAGHIPGGSASARFVVIMERDLRTYAPKLLKAGLKVPAKEGAK